MQILIKYKDMKAKFFFSLIFCLLLVSCNNNEILENELNTLSYLKGVWEVDKVSRVELNANGKEEIDNSTLYGGGVDYFVFDENLTCYICNPAINPEAPFFLVKYSYSYDSESQTIASENGEEKIVYTIKNVTRKYLVLDKNVTKEVGKRWLRYRLKKITWEEFEQTEYYKKAHEAE